jgi:hypothetical protein
MQGNIDESFPDIMDTPYIFFYVRVQVVGE